MLSIHAVVVCATVAGWPCHAHAIHVEVEPGAHFAIDSTRAVVPVDTPVTRRPKAIQYSDWYNRRLTVHRIGSYTMLPLLRRGVVAGAESSSGSGPAELDAGYAPSRRGRDRRAVHREHGHRCLEPVGFPPRAGGKNATIPPRVRDAWLRRRFRVGRGGWRRREPIALERRPPPSHRAHVDRLEHGGDGDDVVLEGLRLLHRTLWSSAMEKQCGADCACVVQGAGGIDRRAFLAQSGMTALAAALAACGLSNSPTAPGSLSQPVTITLSEHPSLANVDGVAFVSDTNGNPLAVVRTGTSTFVALSRICPHAGQHREHGELRLSMPRTWRRVRLFRPLDGQGNARAASRPTRRSTTPRPVR